MSMASRTPSRRRRSAPPARPSTRGAASRSVHASVHNLAPCCQFFPPEHEIVPNTSTPYAGACSIIKPELVAEKVLGVASSGSNAVMIRGAGLAAALLGARLGRDSDSQAASSAALWLGGWAYMLRNAAGVAGRTQTICALLALSAVRRSGGLYNFVTTLDTNGLNAVLPKNRDLTMQNVVGVQMLGWGLGLLFAPEWLTSNIMGGKVSPGVEINQCVGCTR